MEGRSTSLCTYLQVCMRSYVRVCVCVYIHVCARLKEKVLVWVCGVRR